MFITKTSYIAFNVKYYSYLDPGKLHFVLDVLYRIAAGQPG